MKNKIKNIFHPYYETKVDKDNNNVIVSLLKNGKELKKMAYPKEFLNDKEKFESFLKNRILLEKLINDLVY